MEKKPYRNVDKIYGYKTMKVPEVLHQAIKERAEAKNKTIIDYLDLAIYCEMEISKISILIAKPIVEEILKEVK